MGKQDGTGRQVTSASAVDDLTAHLLHVDMDAFFASVELLEHPELVGKPVIVGHPSARSVVTAATYEARRFGVNSAMPMAVALRRCPQAIVLEPHYDRYTKYSGLVMDIFRDVTPLVEVLGIDEAFLDVAGARRLMGTPWQIGTRIRERVFAETGLRCSVGAAATKYVAKLASSRAKPDGLLVIPETETLAFLHPQPISALWGVGAKTAEKLERLGLRTVGDVANIPVEALTRAIGPAMAAHFHALSWGRDPRVVVTEHSEKSIGHERTFETNISDVGELEKEMLRLANAVGVRLRRAGVQARTIALKLRFGDFSTISRSRTLADPTDLGRRIYEEARSLYAESGRVGEPIRLLGVRGEQLTGRVADLGLWDDDGDWREAEQAVDAITAKFGRSLVRPATLLGDDPDRRMPMRGEPT
ncbi:DNA polymerase IV [Pseudolysinimonas yzui]|uniref:DNA polymerase IV n=1 Tax=Pseudolysinimonas yzui TaxID=2708254 RepID=A0A8J3GP36_9MICO|nr:DNA polymerase IV [Pseudolysinimonas yzui]GHF09545.1 DNA polymerase IV [Pseudolysinimonas yzui]